MSPQSVLAVLGAVAAAAVFAGVFYANFRNSVQKERVDQLRGWGDDLRKRLADIEPQLERAQRENEILRQIANPTARLEEIQEHLTAQDEVLGLMLAKVQDSPQSPGGGRH